MRHERGQLTDYAWCSNAHDVTAFREKLVYFFSVWTVATLLCFGVKTKTKKNPVNLLHGHHFNHKLRIYYQDYVTILDSDKYIPTILLEIRL